jgi:hypothetical protein
MKGEAMMVGHLGEVVEGTRAYLVFVLEKKRGGLSVEKEVGTGLVALEGVGVQLQGTQGEDLVLGTKEKVRENKAADLEQKVRILLWVEQEQEWVV